MRRESAADAAAARLIVAFQPRALKDIQAWIFITVIADRSIVRARLAPSKVPSARWFPFRHKWETHRRAASWRTRGLAGFYSERSGVTGALHNGVHYADPRDLSSRATFILAIS
jgi:hypothetical protein